MKKLIHILIVMVITSCLMPHAIAVLSDADKEFLVQSQVAQADIDIILKLSKETQNKIGTWIAAKDVKELASFKNSRDYYQQLLQLKPSEQIPLPPDGWNTDYLTEGEYANYAHMQSDPVRIFER